jgi:hypothetical protein
MPRLNQALRIVCRSKVADRVATDTADTGVALYGSLLIAIDDLSSPKQSGTLLLPTLGSATV